MRVYKHLFMKFAMKEISIPDRYFSELIERLPVLESMIENTWKRT